MLDSSALSQLSQLKDDIRADKDIQKGTVRGSQGRFGFASLDDGREAFLPPDTMARVFPGDRVEASLTESEANKGKWDAELEGLIESELKVVFGRYVVRGKGHFIATDMPQFNRWLFIPPKERKGLTEGDFLECKITRHPFEDGKSQVRVIANLGKETDLGIEHKVTVRKHQLPDEWTKAQLAQAETISTSVLATADREDFTDLALVTIDAETTKDMDDAVYAITTDNGWKLTVAIADPSSAIAADSPLDQAAYERANTAYLPGRAVTMLPETLSHGSFSLVAGENRAALVCEMQISQDGEITDYRFCEGVIRSRHKLSYDAVADFIENQNSAAIPEDVQQAISDLDACAQALNSYRAKHMLLMEDRDDFELVLDEQLHVKDILRQQRNRAQQVVEESMLATNRSAGDFFARKAENTEQCQGIFSSHGGFREERIEGIKAIIGKELPELAELDLTSREGYVQLIQTLQHSEEPDKQNLLLAFRLMLQAGVLTHEAKPHMGLGMEYYATVTSPIRRYNDLYNHRAIKALLASTNLPTLTDEALAAMQERIGRTRRSARDLEQWLICLFMENHKLQDKLAGKPQTLEGKVVRVTSGGVAVQINHTGIQGFVRMNSKEHKFDAERMTLTSEKQTLALNKPIHVVLDDVNLEKKQVNFKQVLEA